MNLPEVPNEKKSAINNHTLERNIVSKLINHKQITISDKESLINVITFYKQLENNLKSLNYDNLTRSDLKNLIDYINKVFYYTPVHTSPLQISKLFRTVKNKSILGTNDSIEHTKFLTYPPDHIVRKANNFNRANSPLSNVFYGSGSIETTIIELKPDIGEKVTVGEWTPINSDIFKMAFIFHNKVPDHTKHVTNVIMAKQKELFDSVNPMLKEWLSGYMNIMGHEFSKPVNNHLEYVISATLSEKIFENDKKSTNNIDGLIYPSISNNYHSHNVAMKKNVIRQGFKLSNVTEFIITKTFYDTVWNNQSENGSPIRDLIEGSNKKEGYISGKQINW